MTTATLLEREVELGRLSQLIESALRGRGSVVAVEGDAGIGKSALLACAERLASAAGLRPLLARCGAFEQAFPYGVVRQLFEPVLASATASRRDRLMGGAAGLAVPAFAPAEPEAAHDERGPAVLHGLYWLAANLAADRPLLVAIDDAHWADAASLRFLHYLGRRIGDLPILAVYAARTGEGTGRKLPLEAEPGLVGTVLSPAGLSETGTGELVARLLRGERAGGFVRACHVATRGNPFLLHELLWTLEAEGVTEGNDGTADVERLAPRGVARAVLARLRGLGDPETRLACAVAVLGANAELRHAAALAQLDLAAAEEAADTLAGAAILLDQRPLEFTHPIVRASIHADIGAARRAASHKQAARLLAGERTGPDQVATHLLAAEPAGDGWVVDQLRAAARAALRRGAPEAACTYLERAHDEPPHGDRRAAVLRELGSAALRAGRPDAVDHLRTALEASSEDGAGTASAGELAVALTAAGRAHEAVGVLEAAIARIGQADPETAMRLEAQLADAMHIGLETAKLAHGRLARYETRLEGRSPGERLLLASVAFHLALRAESPARAILLAERALAGGALLAEQVPDTHSFYHAVMTLVFAERFEQAEGLLGLAVDDARTRGSVLGFAVASTCRAHVYERQGRITEAEAEARGALEALRPGGWTVGPLPLVTAYLLEAMTERADLDACEALLVETGTTLELPPTTITSPLVYARGHLRLAARDPGRALADFEELQRRDARWGIGNPAAWATRASAAHAHAQLGRREDASRLARQELAIARRWGARGAVALCLRAAAVTEGHAAAIDLLREAVATASSSPARCELARSLAGLGAALRRAGHPRDAREPLREALDHACACGARRLAAATRAELVAAGARPRRMALTGLDSLTASERRVAQLAADGLANREIAQGLFVTLRTVEGHLTQAYRKLGIHSREQLASALRAKAAP